MAICPNCEARSETVLDPCPTGDGYFCVDESDFAANREDDLLGVAVGGRFVVVALLGKGSMAHVYRAHQLEVDRTVALKVFRVDELLTRAVDGEKRTRALENARMRFAQEARVLGKLAHPNCVTLFDFGNSEDGRYLYIAMEHIGGISLRRAINRGLKLEAIMEIAQQILFALREAHSLGIVHRDLKPENIILSFRYSNDEPVVKVVDFGIAKLLGRDRMDTTNAGALFGTPAYMSPEQCRGEVESIGPHSDVYALGCILYEMVCARLPYESKIPVQMLQMHQQDPIPEITPRSGLEMTDEFKAFIRRCMQKDPGERYIDSGEALGVLNDVMEASGFGNARKLARPASGSKRVVVPKNQLSGIEIDPPSISPSPSASRDIPVEVTGRKDTSAKVLETFDPADESDAAIKKPRKSRGGAGTAIVLLAFFFLIVACVLLFYFMWETV